MKAYTIDYREIDEARKVRIAKKLAREHRRREALGCLIEAVGIMGIVMLVATITFIFLGVAR